MKPSLVEGPENNAGGFRVRVPSTPVNEVSPVSSEGW